MSSYHYIFLSPRPLADDELVGDVSIACGEPLRRIEGSAVADYGVRVADAILELELTHDYEEDFGIHFEQFDSLVTVRDVERDQKRQEQKAREVYRQLTLLDKYSLELVYNLQESIDSFTPSKR